MCDRRFSCATRKPRGSHDSRPRWDSSRRIRCTGDAGGRTAGGVAGKNCRNVAAASVAPASAFATPLARPPLVRRRTAAGPARVRTLFQRPRQQHRTQQTSGRMRSHAALPCRAKRRWRGPLALRAPTAARTPPWECSGPGRRCRAGTRAPPPRCCRALAPPPPHPGPYADPGGTVSPQLAHIVTELRRSRARRAAAALAQELVQHVNCTVGALCCVNWRVGGAALIVLVGPPGGGVLAGHALLRPSPSQFPCPPPEDLCTTLVQPSVTHTGTTVAGTPTM